MMVTVKNRPFVPHRESSRGQRKQVSPIFLIFLFLFSFSLVSALVDGDAACMDDTNWCSDIFILGDYYYCDIDDVIVCEYGCEDHECQDLEVTPECSSDYEKCEGQSRYTCINNSWVLQEVCDYQCLSPMVQYSYCTFSDTEIPEVSSNVYSYSTVYSHEDSRIQSDLTTNYAIDKGVNITYTGDVDGLSLWLYSTCYKHYIKVWDGYDYNNDLVHTSDTYVTSYDDNLSNYEEIFFPFDSSISFSGEGVFRLYGLNSDDSYCSAKLVHYGYYGYIYERLSVNASDWWVADTDSTYENRKFSYSLFSNSSEYTEISEISMGTSDSFDINLSYYYGDYDSVTAYFEDPLNSNFISISLADNHGSLFGDYFDIEFTSSIVDSTDYLTLYSYGRPYNYSFLLTHCLDSACSTENISVSISGSLSNVSQLEVFPAIVDLGFYNSQTFSGNYYFQYYDYIIFKVPDSNYTGILNSSFPFAYNLASPSINGADYIIQYNCSIDQDVITYSFLGDVNFTLECGSLQAYYTLTAFNNYNQTIEIWAYSYDDILGEEDYFLLYAGNPSLETGELPDRSYLDPVGVTLNSSRFDSISESLKDLFYSNGSVPQTSVIRGITLFFLVLLIFCFVFVSKYFKSIEFAFAICYILFNLLLFFYSYIGYLPTYAWPVFLASLGCFALGFKHFWRSLA